MTWHDSAACLGEDTDAFFDARNGFYDQAVINICRSCSVRLACLNEALDYERTALTSAYGYRGGMSPESRARILRKERRKAA